MENQTWEWVMGPSYTTTTNWKNYEVYFTANKTTDALIVQFDFGLNTGAFRFDDISITRFGGIGLEEGESIASGNIKRVKSTEIGKYSKRRVGDNAEFYFDLERQYTDSMKAFLENRLGVKCPVTFTNNYYGLASIYSQAGADYIDTHHYWDHPNYKDGFSNTDFTMQNKSMVLSPASSTVNSMPRCRVKNMPLVVSEYNHPYPYIFQGEAPSFLYAYGSYLDLDGIMWHAYYDYMDRYKQRYQDMFFDIAMNPVIMTQMLLATPYRLGYISPPEKQVSAYYNRQDIFDHTKTYQDHHVLNMPGGDYGASFLVDGFSNASFDAATTHLEGELTMPSNPVISEKGELTWDAEQGVFTVDNPYWQGATGFLKDKTITLQDIALSGITTTNDMDFASVQLIALDSLPIRNSKRLLLLTSARLENEGFQWNASKTSPVEIGGTRALCEPVSGTIRLNFQARDSFYVYKLDETGARSSEMEYSMDSGNPLFQFNEETLWYEILNDSTRYDSTIAVHEERTSTPLKCYPNPCNDYTFIVLSGEYTPQPQDKLQIFNGQGRIVQAENLPSSTEGWHKIKIDMHERPEGLYFYGLKTAGRQVRFGKFLVVR